MIRIWHTNLGEHAIQPNSLPVGVSGEEIYSYSSAASDRSMVSGLGGGLGICAVLIERAKNVHI